MQAPLLAYNHFVEAMFTLNAFKDGLPASSGGAPSPACCCHILVHTRLLLLLNSSVVQLHSPTAY